MTVRLAIAFTLDMYWPTIAHERAMDKHDGQHKNLPLLRTSMEVVLQYRANAVEQVY